MNITKETKLSDILKEYPYMIDEAIKINEKFRLLKSPVGKLFIRNATIGELSNKAGLSSDELILNINKIIQNR